jgi:GAF domain-containing protein
MEDVMNYREKTKAQLIAELQAAREDAAHLARETEQRNAELAIINSVQEGLASKLDLQAIYDLVGDKIRDIFDAQVVDIGLFDRSENLVHFPYTIERGVRFPDEPMALIGYRKHVIDTRQPLLIRVNQAEAEAQYGNPHVLQGEPAKSSLYVPMLVGGEAKGVISLQNLDREEAFHDADVQLLQTLANSMSVALENARLLDEMQRLYQAEQQRAAELAVINRISQALASELEPDALIQLAGERLRETFNADIVYVALLDRAANVIHFRYGFGTEDFTSFPFGEGLTSKSSSRASRS